MFYRPIDKLYKKKYPKGEVSNLLEIVKVKQQRLIRKEKKMTMKKKLTRISNLLVKLKDQRNFNRLQMLDQSERVKLIMI